MRNLKCPHLGCYYNHNILTFVLSHLLQASVVADNLEVDSEVQWLKYTDYNSDHDKVWFGFFV